MKAITLEDLKRIKKEFTKRKHRKDIYPGLCITIRYINRFELNSEISERGFNTLLASTFKNKKVYYDNSNRKTGNKAYFYWSQNSIKPRLKWLDKQIKLKEKDLVE